MIEVIKCLDDNGGTRMRCERDGVWVHGKEIKELCVPS